MVISAVYFLIIFFILCLIGFLPFFRQTKKNLMWFVLTVIFISSLLIIDLGVEFLAFAYLIIYIGAVAVMFLFIIVTVDPKFENQKDTFEKMVIPAVTLNNFLTFIIYFCILSPIAYTGPKDIANFYILKNEISDFFLNYRENESVFWPGKVHYHFKIDRVAELQRYVINSWFKNEESFYSILEFKFKDIYIFADSFFNQHAVLLVIVGFILTLAMIVSVIIAKDCVITQKK